MNRRSFIRNTVLVGAAVTVAPTIIIAKPREETLTILHTNDWHSRIDPFPMDGGKYQGQGGAAMRAQMIKNIRANTEHVLLFDAGDIFQGTPYFNFYKGDPEISLMNDMQYDATTIGNHDFDVGIDGLARQVNRARFPFVCANYDFNETPLENKIFRHRILVKEKLRVGITGVGIELRGLVPEALYGKTKHNDPVPILNKTANELKEKHKCDLVVCLSHVGYEYANEKISDVKLAAASENVDIIVGGHTHTFLHDPRTVNNIHGSPVTIVQAGWAGLLLGRIDVRFNRTTKRKRVNVVTDKVAK